MGKRFCGVYIDHIFEFIISTLQKNKNVNINSNNIIYLKRIIEKEIFQKVFKSLVYCMNVKRLDGELIGNTPEERYLYFSETEQCINVNRYPFADVVIMYFDRAKMKKSTFEFIVKVKGELGQLVPILAVIEEGSAQDIFSVLEAGIFDYIEVTDNLQKYAKKIEELFLWGWYLRKYEFLEKRGCREIDNLKQEQ